MKKVLPIVVLIPALLLASCSNNSNSDTNSSDTSLPSTSETTNDVASSEVTTETPDKTTTTTSQEPVKTVDDIFKEKLELLKVGYVSDNIVSEKYYPKTNPTQTTSTKYLNQTSAIKDKFSLKLYNRGENEQMSVGAFETIYNVNGDACQGRLNINNEINMMQILHPSGNGVFRFKEDGYENFFTKLEYKDFKKTSASTFTLNAKQPTLNNVYKAIGTQMYGNPGFTIKYFSIYLDKNYDMETTIMFETFSGKTYNYDYNIEGKLKPIEVSQFEDRNVPFKEVEDELFTNAINSLKAYNFTLTQQDFIGDDNLKKTSTLLMNPDKFYSTTLDSNNRKMSVGMYKDGEVYQTVTKNEEGQYLKGTVVSELEFLPYFPSFKINRAVFDKSNNIYTLKRGIDGDPYVFTPYETEASELNRTTIEINKDSIVFTNVFGSKGEKLVTTFTNIGTTDVGYSKEDVIDPSNETYEWKDILKAEDLAILTAFLNNDLSSFPTPQGLKDKKAWSLASQEGQIQIVYASASMPASEKSVSDFNALLPNLGWELIQGEAIPAFSKTFGDKTLIIQAYLVGTDLMINLFDSALLG